MNTTEATIKIARVEGKITSVSILMPIWSKESAHKNLLVSLPLLGLETIAKDEADAEIAIEEAIRSFCQIAEKFGQGVERELQAMGWVKIDGETGEPELGYNVAETDDLLDRLLQTGENYINPQLNIVDVA